MPRKHGELMGSNETRNLWLAIGAGIFATFLLYSYSQEKKQEVDKQLGSKKRVVVIKTNVSEMDTIYETALEYKEIPTDYVEPDAVDNIDDIIGSVAAVPMSQGQQVTKNKLLEPGPNTGISMQVAPSKRAITLPVNDYQAVAKLIRPGDRVDVFAAIDIGKGVTQRREVQLLLQDIVILATGINIKNNIPRSIERDASGKALIQTTLTGDTKYNTVTVEVEPKDAQGLIFLLSTAPGNIFLALRNPSDRRQIPRMPSSTAETLADRPQYQMPTTAPMLPPGRGQ